MVTILVAFFYGYSRAACAGQLEGGVKTPGKNTVFSRVFLCFFYPSFVALKPLPQREAQLLFIWYNLIMENFSTHIGIITGKKIDHPDKLLPFFQKKSISRGTILLRPGERVLHAWSVYRGILRAFYYQEEQKHTWKISNESTVREVTPWVVPAPGFLTDISGFLLDKPSNLYIEALEDCELYCLSKENYKSIQREFSEFAGFIFERSLIMADSRIRMLHLRHPSDRFNQLEKMYPKISSRLSVNVIASYLNVNPSTISKLRGKKD